MKKIKDKKRILYEKTDFSEAVSGALDKSRIMKDVEMFCRLDRYTGSRDGEEAAERIAERMEELGIPVEREKNIRYTGAFPERRICGSWRTGQGRLFL